MYNYLLPVHLVCPVPRERDAVCKEFVYLILFLKCVANLTCLLKKSTRKRCFISLSRYPCLIGLDFLFSFKVQSWDCSSKKFVESHFLASGYFHLVMTQLWIQEQMPPSPAYKDYMLHVTSGLLLIHVVARVIHFFLK